MNLNKTKLVNCMRLHCVICGKIFYRRNDGKHRANRFSTSVRPIGSVTCSKKCSQKYDRYRMGNKK